MSVRQFYVILNLLTTGNVILHGFSNSVEKRIEFIQTSVLIYISLFAFLSSFSLALVCTMKKRKWPATITRVLSLYAKVNAEIINVT